MKPMSPAGRGDDGTKKKPTKFASPVQLQEACDAVELALDD
jgi:hypothetical protein